MQQKKEEWMGQQVTAKAASKARDTQTVVKIEMEEKPEFYK